MSTEHIRNNLVTLITFINSQIEAIDTHIYLIANSSTTSIRDLRAKMTQIENLKSRRQVLVSKLDGCFDKLEQLNPQERNVKRSAESNEELLLPL